MIAILGSGFGLYGYLPSLVRERNESIVLPERYKSKYLGRPELAEFSGKIEWAESETVCLDRANTAVLALRPLEQEAWIKFCLEKSHIKNLILEKPLARSPELALELYKKLNDAGKNFRIGYIFRYTWWAQELIARMRADEVGQRVTIRWSFLAHHFRTNTDNWKRHNMMGGGAVRFYGIHLIALLAEIGYRNVVNSETVSPVVGQVEKWRAVFSGPNLPECELFLDTHSEVDEFQIELDGSTSIQLREPFQPKEDSFSHSSGNLDPRVPILEKICRSISEDSNAQFKWYRDVLNLWSNVEVM